MYSLRAFTGQKLEIKVWAGACVPKGFRRESFLASAGSWCSVIPHVPWLAAAWLQSLPIFLCVLPACLSGSLFSLLARIPVTGLEPTPTQDDLMLTEWHLQKPCFQKRPYSKAPDRHESGVDATSPTTPMSFDSFLCNALALRFFNQCDKCVKFFHSGDLSETPSCP